MAPIPPGSAVFLDTNILVYASFAQSPLHDVARRRLGELDDDGAVLWTSRQVLREYLAVTSRPGAVMPTPPVGVLVEAVRRFEAEFVVADENAGVTARLLDLLEKIGAKGKQVHDANIVATMRSNYIPYLLTHNLADFARYASVITALPLVR